MNAKVEKMRKANSEIVPIKVLRLLEEETDAEHPMTTSSLSNELNAAGLPSNRRIIYHAISILKENGWDIRYIRTKEKSGYYLNRSFTLGEINFLANECARSNALSIDLTSQIVEKVSRLLSIHERNALFIQPLSTGKTTNPMVMEITSTLLKAISLGADISFLYYDITIARTKKYRRQANRYIGTPRAIVNQNGRMYCVIYSATHANFANYRIDKMESVEINGTAKEICPFDIEDHIRSSFLMYYGSPQTVTVRFNIDMASIVMDQFGQDDIIITSVNETDFTAAIKTAITPTLIGWLLQFYDRATAISPGKLVDSLLQIADVLKKTYKKETSNE